MWREGYRGRLPRRKRGTVDLLGPWPIGKIREGHLAPARGIAAKRMLNQKYYLTVNAEPLAPPHSGTAGSPKVRKGRHRQWACSGRLGSASWPSSWSRLRWGLAGQPRLRLRLTFEDAQALVFISLTFRPGSVRVCSRIIRDHGDPLETTAAG